jgi:uncharacterized protein (TIGR03118 family)
MKRFVVSRPWRTLLLAGASLSASVALAPAALAGDYQQTNLVTDSQAALAAGGYSPAAHVDPNLINPWGMDRSPTGQWWVSNTGTATSTLYNGAGVAAPLVVTTPQNGGGGPAGPTGQVYNGGSGFALASGGPARFIISNLDGSISAWNGAQGSTAVQVVPGRTGGNLAAYTGLAIGSTGGQSYLYAANNITGGIDVFDQSFAHANLGPNAFVDPNGTGGLAAFNAQNLGGNIFVTYAVGGPPSADAPLGSGFVDEFGADGTFMRRFAQGGDLASPWGLALAPGDFGVFSNDILIGNFTHGDYGYISAYAQDGTFQGLLSDQGTPIAIDGLWALEFGNDAGAGPHNALYFAAGIGAEAHGLFGEISSVPEPTSWALMILGFGFAGAQLRAKRRRTLFAG